MSVKAPEMLAASSDGRSAGQLVSDDELNPLLRLEALQDWIAEDARSAGEFLISELNQPALAPEWRGIVIYAVDSIRFEDAPTRAVLATALLKHANELRQSSMPDDLPVAMCAIRRAGSILPESRVDELLPFLNRDGFVDTRLVALQAVVAIYTVSRPQRDLVDIRDRAFALAEKHWDLDVFQASEVSALAIEATVVAAMLDHPQTSRLIDMANQTKRRLLLNRLRTKLENVATAWNADPIIYANATNDRHP